MNVLREVLEREYLEEFIVNDSILFGNMIYLKQCLDDYFALRFLNDWEFVGLGFDNVTEVDDDLALIHKGEFKKVGEVGGVEVKLENIHLNFAKQCAYKEFPQYVKMFNEQGFNIELDKMSKKVLNDYHNDEASLYIGFGEDSVELTIETASTIDFGKYFITLK